LSLRVAAGDYATHQNPFVYFHSLLDLGDCQSDDLSLTKLDRALGTTSQTPSYTFIAPDPCDAGLVDPCPDGKPGGLAAADAFLQHVVPTILKSPAYRASGALVIAFTAGGAASGTAASSTTTAPSSSATVPSTTTTAPSSSATVPSTTTTAPSSSATVPSTTTTASTTVSSPTTPSTEPIRTGALILSRYTRAGSTDPKAYNPYSVVRSAEDVFGLSPLGRAKGAASFAGTAFAAG
jgi:phosphatidylinositol-3-phosphatase